MAKQYLEAGEIVNTHGIRGEVKINPWADGPEFLVDFDTFYLNGVPYAVESARVHKSVVLCKLEGVDTIEQAQKLRGTVVCIDRDEVELEEDAVFIADLIGLPVLADGVEIGRVEDVLTMPGNDVYVVKGQRSYMIPAVKEFLLDVNVEEGYVRVKLIEGMCTDEN
ncbi:ribosome maturation factor RimM [Candidatus Avoscillospira sp. LCP25S3_F1]|uniref:ribosome maturation factor RimM n=1 Tax=Candidatus Avoscillospira sp. LCP25S3_F1 TaxID=3438825 RepID=UPI003F90F6C1